MNLNEVLLRGVGIFTNLYDAQKYSVKTTRSIPPGIFAKTASATRTSVILNPETPLHPNTSRKRRFSDVTRMPAHLKGSPLKRSVPDFDSEIIINLRKQLNEHEELHKKTGVQNHKRAVAIKLALCLSDILLNDSGNIRAGIIQPLRKALFGNRKVFFPYEQDILFILNKLETSRELRAKFKAIRKPSSPEEPINLILRLMLSLDANTVITDRHAKLAALFALFSHLRQGNSGSCFATRIAINQLTTNPEKCLDDFESLIAHSKLTRIVDGQMMEFPIFLSISRDDVDWKVKLNQDGNLVVSSNKVCPLELSPGFNSAFDAIGLGQNSISVRNAIKQLFMEKQSPSTLEMTVQELLIYIIDYVSKHRIDIQDPADFLETKAMLAFEAQTNNLLQRVWEVTIAGMAEADKESLNKKKLLTAVVRPLKSEMKNLPQCNRTLRKRIAHGIKDYLTAETRLLFDPSFRIRSKSDEYKSSWGFILYDKNGFASLHQWKRIDTSSQFTELIRKILHDLSVTLKGGQEGNFSKNEISETFHKLKQYTNRNSFLEAVLMEYHPENKKIPDLLKKMESLKHTPWMDNSGNDHIQTLKIYTGGENPSVAHKMTTPEALLYALINLGKKEQERIEQQTHHEHELRPLLVTETHAFCVMLGHRSLSSAWKSGIPAKQWIQKTIIQPGLDIANSPIPSEMCKKILNQLGKQNVLCSEMKATFLNKAKTLPDNMTYAQFRSKVREIITEIVQDPNGVMIEFDNQMFSVGLTSSQQRMLRNSAVHFGNTNWHAGVHDKHYCFIANPGSGEMEIWKICEDGKDLMPIDQAKWFNDCELEYEDQNDRDDNGLLSWISNFYNFLRKKILDEK